MMEAFFSCEQCKPRTPATPYCDTYYVIRLETKTAGFPRKARYKHLSKIFLRSKQSKAAGPKP